MFGMIWTIESGLTCDQGLARCSSSDAVLEARETADPRGDGRADTVGLAAMSIPLSASAMRAAESASCENTVHAPCLLAVDPGRRVEVLELAREVHRVVASGRTA